VDKRFREFINTSLLLNEQYDGHLVRDTFARLFNAFSLVLTYSQTLLLLLLILLITLNST